MKSIRGVCHTAVSHFLIIDSYVSHTLYTFNDKVTIEAIGSDCLHSKSTLCKYFYIHNINCAANINNYFSVICT